MVSCFWCTTSSCYQDKDAVEYYVPSKYLAKVPNRGLNATNSVGSSEQEYMQPLLVQENETVRGPQRDNSKLIDLN